MFVWARPRAWRYAWAWVLVGVLEKCYSSGYWVVLPVNEVPAYRGGWAHGLKPTPAVADGNT